MNTKKNKNKQKQHKPSTPQPKPEVSDAVTEKIEQPEQPVVEIKTDIIKSEVRVPEIVSENVQTSLENKLSESDAPKKPKRNRGKKKKTDKGDETEEILDEPVLEESKNVAESKEIQDSNITDGKPPSTPELTPVARKKKNKNKKIFEQSEKQAEQEVKVSPIKKDEELTDLKIITVVPVATEGFEEPKSKKKNKKKKRTDSERSEKAEEVLSCTAAFQKLLESKDDKKDLKKDTKQENIAALDETPTLKNVGQGSSTKPVAEISKETLVPEPVKRDKSTENRNESREESGKGKKKNKKDKKHPPKEESEDEAFKPLQTKTEIDSEGQTVTVPADTETHAEITAQKDTNVSQLDVVKPSEVPLLQKEKSPKPKAKIAKPVEKKRKDKQDVSSTENLTENVPLNILTENKPKSLENIPTEGTGPKGKKIVDSPIAKSDTKEQQKTLKTDFDNSSTKPEQGKQETPIADIKISEQESDKNKTIQSTEVAPETAKIELPESGTGKRRKKSPKPKPLRTTETTDQPLTKSENIVSDIQQESSIQKAAEQICEPQEPEIAAVKANEPSSLRFELVVPQESSQIKVLETPEITKDQPVPKETIKTPLIQEEIPPEKLPEKETIQVFEASTGKKRKKSPKPQRKSGKPDVFPEFATSSADVASTLKEAPKQIKTSDVIGAEKNTASDKTSNDKLQVQQMTDSISDLPVLEDIEIRSVKADESEGSACDITPDIHYPRASSQLFDDNNNTVIREVTAVDVKLNIPSVLPEATSIKPENLGSVETPLPPPDRTHPGLTITEVSTITEKEKATPSKSSEQDSIVSKPEDKTDLKSKVLDVNQGMEELRRSIERSLAELSSMEKSEKEAEDQFFRAQAKLEQISEMASKKSEEKKQGLQSEHVKDTQLKSTEIQKPQIVEKKTTNESKKPEEKLVELFKSEESLTKPNLTQPLVTATADINVEQPKLPENVIVSDTLAAQTPLVPARKDNKGKGKKKKGKQELENTSTSTTGQSSTTTSAAISDTKGHAEETKKEEKSEQKTDNSQEKGKQQSASIEDDKHNNDLPRSSLTDSVKMDFEPIENFEDALYASVDENEQDVNKTFEIIANEATQCDESQNPEINITAPIEDEETANDKKDQDKVNPVSQPKNLLGHPDIPARLNRTDYKKEKNKHQTPNTKQATVKIKDAVPIEVTKESKESQTENKRRFLKDKTVTESITSITSENEEYIYKYSFRKVFLPSACHVCKKELKMIRVPCNFCNLIFYCSLKHKDEDYSQHQGLCFAVSTIVHLKDQKHIYADAKNITGHEYRLLRMQMIVSCEKVLKRRLVPWEQEALLYPRICADAACREWRHNKLVDCEGCGQISYCSDNPAHLPKSHQRWCKSYSLYNKLVVYQQTKGRLEPKLPTKVMAELYQIPEKLNEVLASMYEEKIDMTDIQYAALTQIATAPLTAAYCYQLYSNKMNTIYANGVLKKSSFTIHVVGAELQFEADALNKWEVFFLHLRPDVKDLRVVLIGPDLNPSKLPLDLLSKIKLCENCHQNKRRVLFDFQDKKTYNEYWSTDFSTPDLVCAFNPSIQRSSVFNGKDTWPATVKCILKLKVPFIITSYTMSELQNDLSRIKECSEIDVNTISGAEFNAFASVRPDRNFISDDEMPLLFKNYCFSTVCGAF